MRAAIERAASLLPRVLRVSAYLACVLAAITFVEASRARAAIGEAALEAGDELAKMGDAIGPRNRVRLNGEELDVASAMVDDAPSAVIDRFEAECRAHAGALARELEELETAAKGAKVAAALEGANAGVGIVRRDRGDRSAVACLARDEATGIVSALNAMVKTGDLSKLGKLRYVSAERAAGSTKTHVVAAWTNGPFRIAALVPSREDAGRDAPGSDAPDVARPVDARRLLTANLEGAPYGVRVYDARASVGGVLAGFDREMPARGWAANPAFASELDKRGQAGRAFAKDGADVLVFAGADRRDPSHSVVSIVTLPVH